MEGIDELYAEIEYKIKRFILENNFTKILLYYKTYGKKEPNFVEISLEDFQDKRKSYQIFKLSMNYIGCDKIVTADNFEIYINQIKNKSPNIIIFVKNNKIEIKKIIESVINKIGNKLDNDILNFLIKKYKINKEKILEYII